MSRFIIDFLDTANPADIQTYLETNGLSVLKEFSSLGKIYLAEGKAAPESPLVEFVKNDEETEIKLQEVMQIPVNEENWWKVATYGQQFAPDATELEVTLNEAVYDVYLMDSGIHATHEEFAGQSITNLYSVVDGDFSDSTGHGTALASLITGNTCGLGRALLHNVKIIPPVGNLTYGGLLGALDAIKADSDLKPNTPAAVNMSWSIPHDAYINSKIIKLIESGIAVFAAAGNSGEAIANVTPASIPEVITVGAYTQDFEPADFSNYSASLGTTGAAVNGGAIDVWAPGVDVHVANRGGGYYQAQGTSVSAAIMTGVYISSISRMIKAVTRQNMDFDVRTYLPMFMAGQREGLLNLDSKYAESDNRIASYYKHAGPSMSKRWSRIHGLSDYRLATITEGDVYFDHAFDIDGAAEYAVIGDLPPGIKLHEDGWISGEANGIANGSVSEHYTFSIVATDNEGVKTTIEYSIYVTTSDEDALEKARADKELDIELLFVSNCSAAPGTVPPGTTFCNAAPCGVAGCEEDYDTKTGGNCTCAF